MGIAKPEVLAQPFGNHRQMIILAFPKNLPNKAKDKRIRTSAAHLVLNIHGRKDGYTKRKRPASLMENREAEVRHLLLPEKSRIPHLHLRSAGIPIHLRVPQLVQKFMDGLLETHIIWNWFAERFSSFGFIKYFVNIIKYSANIIDQTFHFVWSNANFIK